VLSEYVGTIALLVQPDVKYMTYFLAGERAKTSQVAHLFPYGALVRSQFAGPQQQL
jgi:hypothetical protein